MTASPHVPDPAGTSVAAASAESELAKERTFGGRGIEVDRSIPRIHLSDYGRRRDEIDAQLWTAATEVGFFQLVDHGIDQELVDAAFDLAARFFALPLDAKERRSLAPGTNSGWEHRSQIRPSTGTRDEKESYQVTRSRMDRLDLWPDESELPGFRRAIETFEQRNWALAMRVLSSFARQLGFEDEFFTARHDPASAGYQCTLRLLHYLPLEHPPANDPAADGIWRAGAHTDFDCLTLLHQRPGQPGLQVSPGAEAAEPNEGDGRDLAWTPVNPSPGVVTCNIGDMLMRGSDDALRSTLHRVRMPRPDEDPGPRYSIAFFAQADADAIIEGPGRRYPPITAADYLQQRIAANFG